MTAYKAIQNPPLSFIGRGEVKGFKFEQIEETPFGFIYEVNTGDAIHYEVFKKKKAAICLDFEKRIYSETDFKFRYPNKNAFGKWAWCSLTLEKAKERVDGFEA